MNKKSVYILGAGFSAAVNLPTSNEFFSDKSFEYLKAKLHNNSSLCNRIDDIQSYVNFRLDKKYFKNNVEEILNHIATAKYLYMESVSDGKPYSADDIFEQIIWYVTCLLDYKTKDALNIIPKSYDSFLKSSFENNDTIITFNYDLVLETALESFGMTYRYGLEEQKTSDKSQIILKLHGSLNWMHCSKCGPVHVVESLVYGNSRDCPHCDSNETSSILIPPVIYKDSYYNDQLFGPLVRESWSLAREALSEASQITFIGFSMSEDAYAKELFKLSLSLNDNSDLKCTVINKTCDDELKKRYNSTIVTTKPVFDKSSFEDYIESI